jgi:hypothetical protein
MRASIPRQSSPATITRSYLSQEPCLNPKSVRCQASVGDGTAQGEFRRPDLRQDTWGENIFGTTEARRQLWDDIETEMYA